MKDETCFTCAKCFNVHISKEEFCEHSHTMNKYPHPVPCVYYKREPETEIVYHDKHVWQKASTNFAHVNGVSWLGWCKKCGAEAITGMPASRQCYDIKITKKYKTGGIYKKTHSKEYLKQLAK